MRARLNDHVCARAFIYDDVFRISIDYILELLARFARSPIIATKGFLMDSGTVPHHVQHTKSLPKSDQ